MINVGCRKRDLMYYDDNVKLFFKIYKNFIKKMIQYTVNRKKILVLVLAIHLNQCVRLI